MPVSIHEITMAAPDIVRVVIRDGAIVRGPLVKLSTPDAATPNTWVTRTNPETDVSESAFVGGLENKYQRFTDQPADAFMDRDAIKNPANWPSFGALSVTDVYVKIQLYDQGRWYSSGSMKNTATMECEAFLKLSGNLPAGNYPLSITGNTFPATTFSYDPLRTRSDSIHATQLGHRPGDFRKIAYLSLWLPEYGTEGRVDFATDYSLNTFHVIDEDGDIQHTGSIVLRYGPTDTETGVTATRYPSTTTSPKIATAVTTGNPSTTITLASHGYSNGEVKYFRGFGGVNNVSNSNPFDNGFGTVTVVDPDTFTVDIPTSGTYVADTYLDGYDSRVYDTFTANRANTHVFELDYSSFEPVTYGKYRIYIPGLGVSWPFEIDPAIYLKAAKNAAKGYMTECWGMSLSSGFAGWNRPPQFRDGKNGQKVFETLMPAFVEVESGMLNTIISERVGDAPWGTSNRVTDWFGGWVDAGDWDIHIFRHAASLWHLLCVGFELLPSAVRNYDLGFPPSSLTISKELYASIDNAASVFHMVIWYLEPFRRTQSASGAVYAGNSYNNVTSITTGGGSLEIPSWATTEDMYLHPADHVANFYYALAAAKLGYMLKDEGYTTVGQMWVDSAELAFSWANDIWLDYDANDITATGAWADHYVTHLDFQTNAGWDNTQTKTSFDLLQTQSARARNDAAGVLYRATEGAVYEAIMVAFSFQEVNGTSDLGKWDYCQKGTGASGIIDYLNGEIGNPSRPGRWQLYGSNTLYTAALADEHAYRTGNILLNWQPQSPMLYCLFPYFAQTPNTDSNWDQWLGMVLDHATFTTGANQQGICCTTGIGYNTPTPLHRDREAAGIAAADIPGITPLTWPGGSNGNIFFNNYSTDSQLNFTVEIPTGLFESTYGTKRIIEPLRSQRPEFERHFRTTFDIYASEYITQQQIVGSVAHNLFLHAYDGNTATQLTNAPISASVTF